MKSKLIIASVIAIAIFGLAIAAVQPAFSTGVVNDDQQPQTVASVLAPQQPSYVTTSLCAAIGNALNGVAEGHGIICDVTIARTTPTITGADGTVLNNLASETIEFQMLNSTSASSSTTTSTGLSSAPVFALAQFALLQPEVAPVDTVLGLAGWTISGIQNHFVGETPAVTFVNAYVTGSLSTVVGSIQQALAKTSLSTASSATVSSPTVNIAYKAGIGNYLTDANGSTLYYFLKDVQNNGTSACYGACAANWPAFYASNLVVPAGLNKSSFGVITRTDGTKQTTYDGWPLYHYIGDKSAGQTNGQGIGKLWYAYALPSSYGSCLWIGQFFGGHSDSANGACGVTVFRQTPQIVLTTGSSSTNSSSSTSTTASIPTVPAPIAVTLDPKSTALLLLDFTYCARIAGCPNSTAIPAAANLLAAARAAGVPVVYTTVPIPSQLANKSGDTVITNALGPDKFLNTSLASWLTSNGIKTVIISGVLTNGAVLYTALEAGMRGYSVVVPEDTTYAASSYIQNYTLFQLLNGPGTSNPTNTAPHAKAVTLTESNLIQFGAPASTTTSSSTAASSSSSATSSSSSSASASSSSSATASATTSASATSQVTLNSFELANTQFSFMPVPGAASSSTVFAAGDFALTASEVGPVLQILNTAGFSVTAINNHLINESPQLTFVHFSTTGNLFAILHVLKTALSATTILGQTNNIPLTISTQDTSGKAISGYFQVEYQNNSVITDLGFSPVVFNLASGQTYQIVAEDYGTYAFSHWADTGSTDRTRTVSITSPTQLVAVYTNAPTTTTTTSFSTSTPSSTASSASTVVSSSATSTSAISSTSSAAVTSTSTTSTSTSPSTSTSTSITATSSSSAAVTTATSTTTPSSTTTTTTSTSTSTPTSTTTAVSSSTPASGGAVTIVMPQGVGDNMALNFSPATVTVTPGTVVTFSDQDTSAPHDVVWDSVPTGASPAASPQVMTMGNTFSVTLTVPGTYTYHCAFHSGWMKATIIVS